MNTKVEVQNTLYRRAKIIEMLERDGRVNIPVLSHMYKVSDVTIRNDLNQLEQKALLVRTRGGAIKNQHVSTDIKLSEKATRQFAEKQLIGKKAASLIKNGETIILDSGTTTLEIAKNIFQFENLTVITNALNISVLLADAPNIKVIVPGGFLRENSLSLVGPSAEESLRNYYCDKAFLGVDGIGAQYGISTPNFEEAHLNRVMIEVSKQAIVVTDSSKFSKRSFAFITSIDKIHTIITDTNVPQDAMDLLNSSGVELIIC